MTGTRAWGGVDGNYSNWELCKLQVTQEEKCVVGIQSMKETRVSQEMSSNLCWITYLGLPNKVGKYAENSGEIQQEFSGQGWGPGVN